MKKAITLAAALLTASLLHAQTYSGDRKFDGVHRQVVAGTAFFGNNVITGFFFGESARYTYHINDRWSVGGGEQLQFLKQLYSFDVMGTYRVPVHFGNIYIDGRFLFNRYQLWTTNESIGNLSFHWQSRYVDLRLGASYIRYHKLSIKEEYSSYTTTGYSEPLTMTFGVGLNIRPIGHPWNLGLFLRNFDEYYYENWNINWGIRFHATLPWEEMKLFGEFNIRPAGSLSQLATRYETSLKLGIRYAW